ncbi:uncharacterized protein MELLADRAFT_66325 [Melampsora larici-populina 98AG31]|uniref:U1-type domain-containing protein n=1 Tax=Melampsora larici-populina (strain 98AG31 / pathotype 3-4-7) TaxID=747676 RepID=F4RYR0_MELLP|nr:uncharacterized protein MELLADRAFT_66325 [Melampsora larici-populina 98AG31]EGG02534.1 hypothetical protein MELLADRAFT_66325 [Melampsora larici-populina 98AG31]
MDRKGAYGTSAAGTDFRKTWDKKEYEEKAKQRDEEERNRMKEVEESLQNGKKPKRKLKDDLPKPTELMKQRETPLELTKNQNKTMIVQGSIRGPGAPGFYCNVCNRTSKDSSSYLDHLNSRFHLRQLGQKTQVERSTLDQVREKIQQLRTSTLLSTDSKSYDFKRRLNEIKEAEESNRINKKAKKLERKLLKEQQEQKDLVGKDDVEMCQLMGFSGGFKAKK